jgi:hypothetical protein
LRPVIVDLMLVVVVIVDGHMLGVGLRLLPLLFEINYTSS